MQISKLSYKSPEYPDLLREIQNPPKQLYVLGEIPEGPTVAIVGTRHCTAYGKDMTYKLASQLAKAGVVIVSGLAYGIDAIAHQATVDVGGKAVAVVASGLDKVGPVGNRGLAKKILKNGAIVSEYDLGMDAFKQNFVARNRIIAGLSSIIVVTEAAASSGALITATFGLNNNRTVMAIPGNIDSKYSAGPNNLLRKGARPVVDIVDVLDELNLAFGNKIPIKAESREEATIIDLIKEGIHTTQDLIERSELSAAQFAHVISLMEITGKIKNLGAGHWSLR